ncbi:P-type DNA transfer protein VirB5 [Bordetella sp. BOR01]|uniref:P-type DNA transfer protein VirB5 n=1 Tax=Bordetella sp. BOR01 TaxID=2854779 RepID=UPI001C48AD9E|nr:P-type DNA transfer protein VirB5 [Bordetella sp. BOR01]MBV7483234.1 P-type DNA transfer protein VirB5 [Bordetella sp. BOR01]
MKRKTLAQSLVLIMVLSAGQSAFAGGIPVIDASNLAQAMQQVEAWGKQFEQMQQQLQQLQRQYTSQNGLRGMADLVNNPELRNYLPSEYQHALSGQNMEGLVESANAIRQAASLVDADNAGLTTGSDINQAFINTQNQNALNRAMGEEGYRQASKRFTAIQTLLDKVNDAPEQKDILDLQARIQAEQAMLANEQNKLNTIAFLARTQRDIQHQQAREIAIKAAQPSLPNGW